MLEISSYQAYVITVDHAHEVVLCGVQLQHHICPRVALKGQDQCHMYFPTLIIIRKE